MAYTKTNWRNGEVALSDTNMNHMEQGIYDAHEAISTLQATLETVINERVLAGKPIGTIEINTTGVNPSTYLGGTWVAWGSGRVPVGVDASDTDFSTAEKTGGEKTHTLTIEEMPSHSHKLAKADAPDYGREYVRSIPNTGVAAAGTQVDVLSSYTYSYLNTRSSDTTGGGQAHNIMQPYITCYMWKRTA
jgi:hypothetical protein